MNSEIENTLAERIKKCAHMAGSGDSLAQKSAIPRRTLETYLSGDAEPKTTRMVAIARAANVSVEWLATGEGPMRKADASPAVAPPPVNMHVLTEVISGIEQYLDDEDLEMKPDKKAELVVVLYEHFIDKGHAEKGAMDRLLKLVA